MPRDRIDYGSISTRLEPHDVHCDCGGYAEHVLLSLSLIDHFESLTRGLVELRTLAFFALFTAGWLAVGMLTLRETKGN